MTEFQVHLVGSIPFQNAGEVFDRVSEALGPSLVRIPDGETGERLTWIAWLERVFIANPNLEDAQDSYTHYARTEPIVNRYKFKEGVSPDDVVFDLPQGQFAIDSYHEFARKKYAGVIPADCRFLVAIAHPISVVERFTVAEQQDAIEARYTEALQGEVRKITDAIPHDQLSIQWDVASAVFRTLQNAEPCRFGDTKDEMFEKFARHLVDVGNPIAPDVELIYHLCYGSAGNRHSVEPVDTADMVEIANRLSSDVTRAIALFHMPVPWERDDEAYFEPLRNLTLRPETGLSLGLVHMRDGVEGTRRRIATAKKYVDDFLIAGECGFGRYQPEQLPELLRVHAETAGLH